MLKSFYGISTHFRMIKELICIWNRLKHTHTCLTSACYLLLSWCASEKTPHTTRKQNVWLLLCWLTCWETEEMGFLCPFAAVRWDLFLCVLREKVQGHLSGAYIFLLCVLCAPTAITLSQFDAQLCEMGAIGVSHVVREEVWQSLVLDVWMYGSPFGGAFARTVSSAWFMLSAVM